MSNSVSVKEKVATVEIRLSVEDFLEQWRELEEPGEPTQADYDTFLTGEMQGYLRENGDCSVIKLKPLEK